MRSALKSRAYICCCFGGSLAYTSVVTVSMWGVRVIMIRNLSSDETRK